MEIKKIEMILKIHFGYAHPLIQELPKKQNVLGCLHEWKVIVLKINSLEYYE